MELHPHHLQFEATSSLTPQQLEVFRLYQHCGVEISNEKFQVVFIKFYNALKYICLVLGPVGVSNFESAYILHYQTIKRITQSPAKVTLMNLR